MQTEASISCLPSEILEYILSLVSPYKDLDSCKLVCHHWRELVKNVVAKHELRFHKSILEINVQWESLPYCQDPYTTISRRYSHAACYYNDSVYIFGGCTSTNTTFNDLWKLNLSTKSWVRPLPTGSYPSPKACATLVKYNDTLVLYGGWTQSSSSPLHQVCQLFNELNIYCLKTNKWNYEYTHPPPPSAAGHSATVHGNHMIVFGGIRKQLQLGQPSQEVVCYNLDRNVWFQPDISQPKPQGRYGQTQVALDENHLLIIGGCGGPNSVYNDVWLLTMEGHQWKWTELVVENLEFSACHIWCSPGCKVNDKVVFLSKRSNTQSSPTHPAYTSHYNISAQIRGRSVWVPPVENNVSGVNREHVAEEPNVNGRKGDLRRRLEGENGAGVEGNEKEESRIPRSGFSNPRLGSRPSIRPNAMKNREKQLEALKLMEERIQRLQAINKMKSCGKACDESRSPSTSGTMSLFVLDIGSAISEHKVRWIKPSGISCPNSPEEAVLYSIVRGKGELIVFGGVQKFVSTEATTNGPGNGGPNIVSNAVYFIKPPKAII